MISRGCISALPIYLLAEQAYAYLRGAEELAGLALLLDYDQDQGGEQPRDDLQEIWAQPTTPYALDEGGWLLGSLQDLQGRFNLNSLVGTAAGENRFTPAQAQFIRLLQALEEPPVSEQEAVLITASVADWLDQDDRPAPTGLRMTIISRARQPIARRTEPWSASVNCAR